MSYGWSREDEARWRGMVKRMPKRRTTIRVEDRYPPEAFERLFRAVLPGEMEDKWIALPGTEETVLDFHRSWTGFHIYRVYLFEDRDGSFYIDRVDVNRYRRQYSQTDDAYDAAMVRFLIRALVLGEDAPYPFDPALAEGDALLAGWSSGGSLAFPDPPAEQDPPSPPADADPAGPPGRA